MWNTLPGEGKIGQTPLTAWIAKENLRTLLALARTGADRHQVGDARRKFLTIGVPRQHSVSYSPSTRLGTPPGVNPASTARRYQSCASSSSPRRLRPYARFAMAGGNPHSAARR
ncbi:hypothetical protein [Streptomyces sp. NPDC058683]|uniref:hypothetical protein n=1 Tax=Streptomyces sp. NPDC058683 TaxID=3346597 RepID=UPI0036589D81